MVRRRNEWYFYAKYANFALSFGFTLIFAVGGGAWLGSWLDRRFSAAPLFLVLGILAGVALSFKSLFELITGMEKTDFAEHEEVNPVYRRAMNLRRLYFKKARVRKGANPDKRKE